MLFLHPSFSIAEKYFALTSLNANSTELHMSPVEVERPFASKSLIVSQDLSYMELLDRQVFRQSRLDTMLAVPVLA